MNAPAKSGRMVTFITAASYDEAKNISRVLVGEKLAACCSIIRGVTSIYAWKGKTEEAEECLIIVKTNGKNFSQLVKKVKDIHSYDLPEIIGMPITEGLEGYLNWIDESLEPK
ncbi:MAG: divalent-cation tolerance protein CutA [bacterium]|nr:MAG: divalent-cation tolerance protein CutA [bacterium]